MSIQLNQKAPDFKLFNSAKHETTLSANHGKNTLLLFFPLAFTSTCTAELCSIRDNIAQYNSLDATVYGISVDSLFTLGKFKEEQHLNFDLLSDFNHDVSKLYGSSYDEFVFGMKGVSKRSAFVIDKNGIVKYAEVLDKSADLPNFDAIVACLQSLK